MGNDEGDNDKMHCLQKSPRLFICARVCRLCMYLPVHVYVRMYLCMSVCLSVYYSVLVPVLSVYICLSPPRVCIVLSVWLPLTVVCLPMCVCVRPSSCVDVFDSVRTTRHVARCETELPVGSMFRGITVPPNRIVLYYRRSWIGSASE